ncbi:MAG: sulfatase-like hydrolase/transferase [Pirellulaceae bacterium]|nr:sulfatase-like hydrolase/transferase [Pirellulaceae bacterium]
MVFFRFLQLAICPSPRAIPPRITGSLACLIWAALVVPAAFAEAPPAELNERTNVVLIMADDVGYECFGCYGSRQYSTPRIDQLAARGMRFNHYYSQPLCTPTRIQLMTGLSNVRNYSAFSLLNGDQRTIGHHFQDAGYTTLVAGKWQLLGAENYPPRFRQQGTWPADAGFDRHCLWQVDRLGSRYWNPLLCVDGTNRQLDNATYGPDVVCDYVLRFLEENRQRPFLVYYPMILVHDPFEPTPDSESRQQKDRQRNFEAMVTYMDKLVGRVVDKLAELGLSERTLVLFSGDNGTHSSLRSQFGERTIQGGKGRTTDAGTREPLVACWPGTIPSVRVSNDLVDSTDFLPTCLEAAGVQVPAGLDGRSFLPQLKGQPGQPRRWLYCYYCPRPERTPAVRFARDQRWKLYGDGRFYDVEQDVLEQTPLELPAQGSEARAAHDKLTRALASFPEEGQSLLRFQPSGRPK